MIVTVGGLSGSGKTTIAKGLAKVLGLRYVSAGELFRKIAMERHMPLDELSKKLEERFDKEIDAFVRREARKGNVVIDSRLAAFFVKRAFKIFVRTDLKARAKRVAKRDGLPLSKALKYVKDRDKYDRRRYRKLYGIDLFDLSPYHLIIDNTHFTYADTRDKLPKYIAEMVRLWKG